MLADLVLRMRPALTIDRLGLASGASVHPSVPVPLGRWLSYGADGSLEASPDDLAKCLGLTVNHTAADVSLISGKPLGRKPVSHASVQSQWWKWRPLFQTHWKVPSHINALEMRMIFQSVVWKCRQLKAVSRRWLHLTDSMVSLLILSKGRTSSRMLQPLANKVGAFQLAMGSYLSLAHVGSIDNPTDAASRA